MIATAPIAPAVPQHPEAPEAGPQPAVEALRLTSTGRRVAQRDHGGEARPDCQYMRALERANEVRIARAELKRQVALGAVDVAQVILDCPWEAASMAVADLLTSQRRWGQTRCRKLLAQVPMSERKTIGSMTDRQRRTLAALLGAVGGHELSGQHTPRLVPVPIAAAAACAHASANGAPGASEGPMRPGAPAPSPRMPAAPSRRQLVTA